MMELYQVPLKFLFGLGFYMNQNFWSCELGGIHPVLCFNIVGLSFVGFVSLSMNTLDVLLSQTHQSIQVSTPCDTIETSLIKPSSVKLRRLSKTAIKLWTTSKPSTESRAPLNIIQTFIPINPGKSLVQVFQTKL